jgi:hypothetical protein
VDRVSNFGLLVGLYVTIAIFIAVVWADLYWLLLGLIHFYLLFLGAGDGGWVLLPISVLYTIYRLPNVLPVVS